MSLFDLFRRFFEPPGRRDPFFGFVTQEEDGDDDDDDDDEDDVFFQRPRHGFQTPFAHGNAPFDAFFRDFNELFADLGSMVRDVPALPGMGPPAQSPGASRSRCLRDFMLKYPDSHLPPDQAPGSQEGPRSPRWLPWRRNQWLDEDPGTVPPGEEKQDRILDSEVSSHGLDSIMRARRPASSSYFQSVSVSRVSRPDGTVEERRTVQDGQGNTTTTVTVMRDGQVISSQTIDPSRR